MCSVCDGPSASQLVPERGESLDCAADARMHLLCTVCFDRLLALFPLSFSKFVQREVTGSFSGSFAVCHRTIPSRKFLY